MAYQIDGEDEQNNIQVKFPSYGQTGDLGRGQISVTMSISKIFIPNFVCVLTNERYKTHQTGFSFCHLGHAPGIGLWGAGVPRGSCFSNMVMWHIKLTGMTSKTECILGPNW